MAYTRAEPALAFLRPLALIKQTNQSLGSASSTPDSRLRRKHANVTGQGGSERHMVPTRLPSHAWKSRVFRAKIPAGGSFFFFFFPHTRTHAHEWKLFVLDEIFWSAVSTRETKFSEQRALRSTSLWISLKMLSTPTWTACETSDTTSGVSPTSLHKVLQK